MSLKKIAAVFVIAALFSANANPAPIPQVANADPTISFGAGPAPISPPTGEPAVAPLNTGVLASAAALVTDVDGHPIVPVDKMKPRGLDPKQYAPNWIKYTGADAAMYPAKMDPKVPTTYLGWNEVSLPDKLPVFSLRLINRMPQLGVILDPEAIKSPKGTPFVFRSEGSKEAGEAGKYDMYDQMYEPTIPHAIESGQLFEVPLHCFMTMPKKGLRIHVITFTNGTTKPVALVPMLGPYGNEHRYNCFPDVLKNAYTMSSPKVHFSSLGEIGTPDHSGYLMSFKPAGGGYITWDSGLMDAYLGQASSRDDTFGNYVDGPKRLYKVFNMHSPKGLNCLVVGSAPYPWVEAILLEFGAKHVTTSEYQVPTIDLPPGHAAYGRMKSIHHEELLANPVQFDMIVSFSSLEHDGLGRYHDPISPAADQQQLRNLFDLLKPGGVMVLEVPTCKPQWITDPDENLPVGYQDWVQLPLARYYGPVLYAQLAKVWQLEGLFLHDTEKKIEAGTEPGIGGYSKIESFMNYWKLMEKGELPYEPPVAVLRKPVDAKWTQELPQ